MEPNSFGRKVGIGVRVAGNIARERAKQAARNASDLPPTVERRPKIIPPVEEFKQRGRNLGQGLSRGSKSFGKSFFGPFAHASSVLWLEITGCFFALFAAFFGQNVYQLRTQYSSGPGHQKFLLYVVLTAIFMYFSASSFVRARLKARKQKAAR
jgi:hypothetical protein